MADNLSKLAQDARHEAFKDAIDGGDKRPVLVSEGDSWFQYPSLFSYKNDIIDHLDSDYLIWSLGAAADTLDNIVKQKEYMAGLNCWKDKVEAFLLSAAGNDIIGGYSDIPVLSCLIKDYEERKKTTDHLNELKLSLALTGVKQNYSKIISDIRNNFSDLPILIHGYDYPFPHIYGYLDDLRNPTSGDRGQWLGEPFRRKGYPSFHHERKYNFRREVLKEIIDRLYEMMDELANKYENVYVVNLRGCLPELNNWRDELHGQPADLEVVDECFRRKLKEVIYPRNSSTNIV